MVVEAVGTCACGARFDRATWAVLAVVDRVDAEDVQRLAIDWPDGYCIELRECQRCAHGVLARVEIE
jgi:hypothetical protein